MKKYSTLLITRELQIKITMKYYLGTSLVVWWLRLSASSTEDPGLISGEGNKIPCAQ